MRVGLDAGQSLAPAAAVEAGLEGAGLNPGQRDAARAILLSPHRTVGVQDHAGSGKTTTLRAVKKLAGENQIVGLAPSASAVHVLAGEADIPARTLQGFLTRHRDVGDGIAPPEKTEEARKALAGSVLILDEASIAGTVQMRALTRIAAQTDVARLVLIGDRRQLRAVEAGQPFGLLQDAGMPTARMDEVVRQRDADLRQAVLHMVADEPRMAVEELGNGVLETESDEFGRKAAQLWLDLDPSLRAGTAILAPTHELRAEINDAVRQGLEDEGVLHGPALEIERYVNLHLTRSQKGDVANYRPGDVAVFHHDVYGVKAKAGDACRVLLAHPGGRERRIDPAGYIRYRLDLYETRPMVLRAGDHVRWTRNDASCGLIMCWCAGATCAASRSLRPPSSESLLGINACPGTAHQNLPGLRPCTVFDALLLDLVEHPHRPFDPRHSSGKLPRRYPRFRHSSRRRQAFDDEARDVHARRVRPLPHCLPVAVGRHNGALPLAPLCPAHAVCLPSFLPLRDHPAPIQTRSPESVIRFVRNEDLPTELICVTQQARIRCIYVVVT